MFKNQTFFDKFGDKIILFSAIFFFLSNFLSIFFIFAFPQDFFFTDIYVSVFFFSYIVMIATCVAYIKNGNSVVFNKIN